MEFLPFIDLPSLLYLAAFSVLTISCIVISAASPPEPNPTPNPSTQNIYPISSSPAEELNAYTHFLNYYSISNYNSDLGDHVNSQNSHHSSSHSNQKLQLDQQFSQVTLTFGSDKPEVYMKMASHAHHKLLCRCPCKHQSPELAHFPHISNTSTISTDLSAHNPALDSDSLSTLASNKQLVPTSDRTFSAQQQSTLNSSASFSKDSPPATTPNHTWLVINDASISLSNVAPASHDTPTAATQHLIVKNNITRRIAYAKMKAMIPFLDPALFIQWIALKIVVSLYVLAKGFYEQGLKKPAFRTFQE